MPHAKARSSTRSRWALAYAWAATLAFAAAIGYFVYFYYIRLGRATAPDGDRIAGGAVFVNVLLFGFFAAHHSLLARPWAKRWITGLLPLELERSTYVWVASLLFWAACWFWSDLPALVYALRGTPAGLAYLLHVSGLLFILRATRSLDALDLAGVRHVQRARRSASDPAAHEYSPPRLHVGGAYRIVRHPLYLGFILAVGGVPRMTAGRLLFVGLSVAYLLVAIPLEERSLGETFGDAYRQYQRRVRWRLLPGVY